MVPFTVLAEDLAFVPLPEDAVKDIRPVSSPGRLALSPDGGSVYLGDQGRQWRVHVPFGGSKAILLRADVKLEVQEVTKSP